MLSPMSDSGGVAGEVCIQLVRAMMNNKDPVLQISEICVPKGDDYFDHKGENTEVGSHCCIPFTLQAPLLWLK